jgi:hypothetical protein
VEELIALFRFRIGYFAAITDEELSAAFTFAESERLDCLTAAGQAEAMVYYVAAALYEKELQRQARCAALPFGVKSEKEGDLARTYDSTAGTADPFGWRARYDGFARMCAGGGAITVGHRYVPCC